MIESVEDFCSVDAQAQSRKISKKLAPFLPEEVNKRPLSQKALAILANTTGVSSVLNGMRETRYVGDSLEVLKIAPFEVKRELF